MQQTPFCLRICSWLLPLCWTTTRSSREEKISLVLHLQSSSSFPRFILQVKLFLNPSISPFKAKLNIWEFKRLWIVKLSNAIEINSEEFCRIGSTHLQEYHSSSNFNWRHLNFVQNLFFILSIKLFSKRLASINYPRSTNKSSNCIPLITTLISYKYRLKTWLNPNSSQLWSTLPCQSSNRYKSHKDNITRKASYIKS
jgi:hypothetical protein